MQGFRRAQSLVASVLVASYLQVALIPARVLAQAASPVEPKAEGTYDEETRSTLSQHFAKERGQTPRSDGGQQSLPETSAVERELASLPKGGASVSSGAAALPAGPATATGMGESFSAQLSTGTMSLSVPFSLPAARGRAQPSLALSYSSAGGFGLAGTGWSLGAPAISRQTDRGIPAYDDRPGFHANQDRFLFGGSELVPICTVQNNACQGMLAGEVMPAWANGWQYFRPRLEGLYLRFFWSPDHRTWRVQSKDGVNLELGAPLDQSGYAGALEVNPDNPSEIARWYVVRQYDSQGAANATAGPLPVNSVLFRYFTDRGIVYLSDIYDTSPANDATTTNLQSFAHHTHLRYEARPDTLVSYRTGWRTEYALRLAGVDVTSKAFAGAQVVSAPRELVRRYHLAYVPGLHDSLLSTVQPEGRCAAATAESAGGLLPATSCPRLPAIRFEYQRVSSGAAPLVDSQGFAFEPFATAVTALPSSPPHSLDEQDVGMLDADQDGLPDLVVTAPGAYGGQHALYLNAETGALGFSKKTPLTVDSVANVDEGVLRLSNPNVTPLDLDADGAVDLVHMPFVKRYEVFSLRKQNGFRWVGRVASTAANQDPKINFAQDARDTRVMDVNADGLVDIVYTSPTEIQTFFALGRLPEGDGKFGQGRWSTPTSADLSTEPVRACAPWSATPIRFSDPDVHVAELNGDGLPDLARVRDGQIMYWPGRGNGTWGTGSRSDCRTGSFAVDRHISMSNAPRLGASRPGRTMLGDVNGDGLADLVEVRAEDADIYLNDGGSAWTSRFTIENTPFLAANAAHVQMTDINGSGTPDLLWGKAHDYKYVDLTGGVTPHLLVRSHNGVGRTLALEYRARADLMREARAGSAPWASNAPGSSAVIVRTTIRDNLDRAGRVSVPQTTSYSYRDPVFEGQQREFRGFREAVSRVQGDASHPTSFQRSVFLLGECDPSDEASGIASCAPERRWRDNPRESAKGLTTLTEAFDEQGVYHSTQHTAYEIRQLYQGLDGRRVTVALPAAKDTYLYDTTTFDASASSVLLEDLQLRVDGIARSVQRPITLRASSGRARLRSQTIYDDFGNVREVREHGCVEGCPAGVDETLIAVSGYTLPAQDPSGWLWREQSSYVTGSIHTEHRREVTHEYDARGNRTRSWASLWGTLPLRRSHASSGTVAPNPPAQSGGVSGSAQVLLTDNTYDVFGHLKHKRGSTGMCASSELDAAYEQLVVRSRVYVGAAGTDGCGTTALMQEVAYDRGLEVVTDSWDPNGRPARLAYDGLGRLTSVTLAAEANPIALAAQPFVTYSYDVTTDPWARPYSIVHTKMLAGLTSSEATYLESYAFTDGLGRTLATVSPADPSTGQDGDWVVSGLVRYDARGAAQTACDPWFYTGDPRQAVQNEPPTVDAANPQSAPGSGCVSQERDGFSRTVNRYDYTLNLQTHTDYHALSADVFDPLDYQGPRQNTPTTTIADGHGRELVSVDRVHVNGTIERHETRSEYLPTGEVVRITRRRGAPFTDEVTRWLRYDSLGRLVMNVEPNTSADFNPDPATSADAVKAWRYAYNDAGQLVGTSDARGCGVNYHHDAGGRLIAKDYSPCRSEHATYSSPNLSSGDGTEAFYRYDTADPQASGIVDAAGISFPISTTGLLGQLVSASELGSKAIYRYDALGRSTGIALRLAKPGPGASTLSQRYAPRWYTRATQLDMLDRPRSVTTGATAPDLMGSDGTSEVRFLYGTHGAVKQVDSSYGTLMQGARLFADGRLDRVQLGDAAATERQLAYDSNHRLEIIQTYRQNASLWSALGYPTPTAGEPTQQMLLEDTELEYDEVGNIKAIGDFRDPVDWPATAKPVSRTLEYDDLYRLTRVNYSHGTTADTWATPFAAEASAPDRPQPSPHVSFPQRAQFQTFAYDYINNLRKADDDALGAWDRSTGTRTFGTANTGPNRLTQATQGTASDPRRGAVQTAFDAAGNVTVVSVSREGPCLPAGASCWQRYAYEWDEIGNLTRARRWDLSAGSERTTFVVPTSAHPSRAADADLRYTYSGSTRVLKSAADASANTRHTAYVFDSLELRSAAWSGTDYALSADTEQVRLLGGLVAGRVVYMEESTPGQMSGGQHVFLQFGDQLGSTAFSVDMATGELVEYTTYTAYGSTDSDYRPQRWASVREPYKFTGKEEDIEVGLIYFGARYYSPYAALWMSADPVRVHELGSDLNPYGYVGGSPLMRVDPDGRDFGISLLIAAVVAAVVAATTSAVTQGVRNGWSNINWGTKGVFGAGLVGFASGLVGGVAGCAAGAAAGALGASAIGSAMVGGLVGGAAGGAAGHMVSAAIHDQPLGGPGLGMAVLGGAVSGFISGGMGASMGASWFSQPVSSAVGTAYGTATTAAFGGSFSGTDFAISLGAGVAQSAATSGFAQYAQRRAEKTAFADAATEVKSAARLLKAAQKALTHTADRRLAAVPPGSLNENPWQTYLNVNLQLVDAINNLLAFECGIALWEGLANLAARVVVRGAATGIGIGIGMETATHAGRAIGEGVKGLASGKMTGIVEAVSRMGLPQAEAVAATNAAVQATGLRTAVVSVGDNVVVSSVLPGAARPVLVVGSGGSVTQMLGDLAVEGGKFVITNLRGF